MTYQDCLDYFYSQLPMFHRSGAAALKTDLHNIQLLCERLDGPESKFPSIHVAGTNGKGSSSHLLAAVLQSAGYRTGLYTSPHIKDFRERIRINGQPIDEHEVVTFVTNNRELLDSIKPSFFEMTVAMAFGYFAQNQVDIAIIEVGLGGRLDSTNIITPLISLITNIDFDHSDLLGNTLESIAREKAGIIKPGVPVVIGERHPDTKEVFIDRAQQCGADIYFAQDHFSTEVTNQLKPFVIDIFEEDYLKWKAVELQVGGPCQPLNIPGVVNTIRLLNGLDYLVEENHIRKGFAKVVDITGIKGRWQTLGEYPRIICDTGHNRAAMEYTLRELNSIRQGGLHMVLGFVNDKDIGSMLEILPVDAVYYFCAANVPRSLAAEDLLVMAAKHDLDGRAIPDPNQALQAAREASGEQDLIFVGGSTFVVAELKELD